MGVFSTMRKNLALSKLMKQIAPEMGSADDARRAFDIMHGRRPQSAGAEEQLFELVSNDPDLSEIRARYGATTQLMPKIYRHLKGNGAGQWVNGAYVPAAAIATKPSLEYLLHNLTENRARQKAGEPSLDDHNFWLRMSYDMVEYFSR